jgi:hypothetical protein
MAVQRLLGRPALQQDLRERTARLALRNGVDIATEAVEQLLRPRKAHMEVRT